MRLLVPVAVVVSLSAGLSMAQSSEEPDFAGVYVCEGTRPDGAIYQGIVEIVRHENTYRLRWTFSRSDQQFGMGVVSGDSLAVGYFGDVPGVVMYTIEQRGEGQRLVGTWTALGANGEVFSETLTRLAADARVPELPPPSERAPAVRSRRLNEV